MTLTDLLNVDISLGALSESEAVVADALTAPVEELRAHAVAAEVKHADGTTWYRAHLFRALWMMATKAVTVFTIFEAGTIEALKAWMGEKGVLVSDRGSQLSFWAMKRRQICWAHLLRKFAWYAEQRGEAGQLGLTLLRLAQFLMHEWHRARDGCIMSGDVQAQHERHAGHHRGAPSPRHSRVRDRGLVRAHP